MQPPQVALLPLNPTMKPSTKNNPPLSTFRPASLLYQPRSAEQQELPSSPSTPAATEQGTFGACSIKRPPLSNSYSFRPVLILMPATKQRQSMNTRLSESKTEKNTKKLNFIKLCQSTLRANQGTTPLIHTSHPATHTHDLNHIQLQIHTACTHTHTHTPPQK